MIVGRRLHSANWPFSLSDDAEAGAHHTLLLFPAPDAVDLQSWYEAVGDQEGAECAAPVCIEDALARSIKGLNIEHNGNDENVQYSGTVEHLVEDNKLKCPVIGEFAGTGLNEWQTADYRITLVVLDGTWEHAQEMFKASLPFLSNFVTQVCLPFDLGSEGHGMGESDLIIRKEPFGGCVSTMEAVARALAVLEPDGHILEDKLMNVLRKMVSLQALHFSSPKIRPKLKKKSKIWNESNREIQQSTVCADTPGFRQCQVHGN